MTEIVEKSANAINAYFLFPQIKVKRCGGSWGNIGDWYHYGVSWIDEDGLLNMIEATIFN